MSETAIAMSSPNLPAVQNSPQQMAVRLRDMGEMMRLTHEFFRDVMRPSTLDANGVSRADGDYGVIPGTDKPTLLKPGAEKLCSLYGYAITIDAAQTKEIVDYETGFMRVVTTVRLVDKSTGEVVGDGIGECNTKEARYARRWVFDRDVPEGLDKRSLKKREGRAKGNGRPYTMYLIENDDPFTLWNTVKKMSKKRALVDATLSATCASQLFTQGSEALNDWIEGEFSAIDDEDEPADPPAPITPAMLKALSNAWGAAANDKRDVLRQRWPRAFPPAGQGVPDPKILTEAEAQDAIALLTEEPTQETRAEAPAAEPCEHEARMDEERAILVCAKCGAALEGPESAQQPSMLSP